MASWPAWLPSLVNIDGNPDDVFGRLNSIFYKDFKSYTPKLNNMEVWHDRNIKPGENYEEIFWHLITKFDYGFQERLLDSRRAERLPWCRPIIENTAKLEVKYWEIIESGKSRIYIWLEKHDYVVVLTKKSMKRGVVAFLVTAFYVGGNSSRKKLERKYNNRI